MLITNMENLSQFYELRHMTEPYIAKCMACSLQTQHLPHKVFMEYMARMEALSPMITVLVGVCWVCRLQAMYFTMHGSVKCLN